MASPQYVSESGFGDWMDERMLCCRFGRCIDPGIEEKRPRKREKYSGDVAMDYFPKMERESQRLALMMEGIAVEY